MKGSYLNSGVSLIILLFISLTVLGNNTGELNSREKPKKSKKILNNVSRYVDAKDFFDPKSPTSGLQEAVDHLKPLGGTVFLSPGVYKIRKSIVLYSGVYISGNGESSVIERVDSCIQRPLLSSGKEGDTEIKVSDAGGFYKGGEVTIFSNTFSGFNSATAMIIEVKANSLKLDRPLRKNYLLENRAAVLNFFPVFTMTKGQNIRIENLVIDGKMKQGADFHGDFVYSAIHLVHVHNIVFDKVIIRRVHPTNAYLVL